MYLCEVHRLWPLAISERIERRPPSIVVLYYRRHHVHRSRTNNRRALAPEPSTAPFQMQNSPPHRSTKCTSLQRIISYAIVCICACVHVYIVVSSHFPMWIWFWLCFIMDGLTWIIPMQGQAAQDKAIHDAIRRLNASTTHIYIEKRKFQLAISGHSYGDRHQPANTHV